MDTKMLFFDIDGTLITEEDGKMPDSTREALHLAHKRGHLLFINTGRTKKSLPKELLNMGFDGYICGCGTHIFSGERNFWQPDFSIRFVKKWQRKCEASCAGFL